MTMIGPTAPDERDVMRSLQEGSPKALATIYERVAPVLYPLALRIVGTRERACAVIEDLFEEIWRDRTKVRVAAGIPRVEWTARCRELAIAQMGMAPASPASEERRRAVTATPSAAVPPAAVSHGARSATDPSSAASAASDPRTAAREALESLPERDRRALEEAYFRGTSAREIATLLGAPTSDAEAMVRAALVRFRDRVDEQDGIEIEMERAS
jgi:RNA polymerase sigma-70 factor, ECF subfamily